MADQITLVKPSFNKNSYEKVINTSFSQLTQPAVDTTANPPISVQQFFTYYQQLFYTIPKFGEVNSHEYLIKTSTDYIGTVADVNDNIIQSLLEEINQLRQENLDLQQNVLDITRKQ